MQTTMVTVQPWKHRKTILIVQVPQVQLPAIQAVVRLAVPRAPIRPVLATPKVPLKATAAGQERPIKIVPIAREAIVAAIVPEKRPIVAVQIAQEAIKVQTTAVAQVAVVIGKVRRPVGALVKDRVPVRRLPVRIPVLVVTVTAD